MGIFRGGSTEVLFAAVSQIFDTPSDLGYDGVDFIKTTFESDYIDCSTQGNCRRQQFNRWAKVLAIAPKSAN